MHLKLSISTIFLLQTFFPLNSPSTIHKILVYAPGYGGSHAIFHARMSDAIAKAGYDVVSLETEIHVNPADFEGPKLAKREIVRRGDLLNANPDGQNGDGEQEKEEEEEEEDYHVLIDRVFEGDSLLGTDQLMASWQGPVLKACEQLVTRKELIEKLREQNFSAIIYEPLLLCGAGLGELIGIKTHILMTNLPLFEYAADLMGLPFPASHVPSVLMPVDGGDTPNFMQRIWNFAAVEMARASRLRSNEPYDRMFKKHFGPSFPNVDSIAREAALCFVMADEFMEFPRPFQANIVPLGHLLDAPKNDDKNSLLVKPFSDEMEKGEKGAVLVSLGTHSSTARLPRTFLRNLLLAFGEHKELHFVMKVDREEVKNMNDFANSLSVQNAFFVGWTPQAKLLAHKNLKFFITHAGFNSLMESTYNGVPVISIPFFVDQLRNANLMARHGLGITQCRIELLNTHKSLSAAIHELVNNTTYKQKAVRIQRLIQNKPLNAQERLKRHLDLLLIHGGGELPEWKSAAREMPWWRYQNLDILLPALFLMQFALFSLTKLLIFVFNMLIGTSKN